MRIVRTLLCVFATLLMVACDCFVPVSPSPVDPSNNPNDPSSGLTVVGLSVQGATSLRVGDSTPWQAVAQLSNGNQALVTTNATWTSSTTSIATVNPSGVVGGVTTGQSTIQASYLGKTASGVITIVSSSVEPPTVASLSIEGNTSIRVGESTPLQAIARMSDGTSQTVTALSNWTSDTPAVATVSVGTVLGVTAGQAPIRATYGGRSASATVTVSPNNPSTPTVVALSITGTTTVQVGQTTQLQATATFSDGSSQVVTSTAAWTSGATNIATVSGGLVTGQAVGTAPIQAAYQGKVASAGVLVTSPSTPTPTVLSLSIQGTTSVQVGQTTQLQATANLSDGSTQVVTGTATWTTGSPSIATVAAGLVSGQSAGTASIQAAYQGKTASVNVVVTSPSTPQPTVNSLSISGNTSIQVGQTTQLQATANMSDGSTQTVTSTAAWNSATTSVATVSVGLVTGQAVGTSVVSATYSGKSAQVTITVSAAAPTKVLTGIEVTADVDLTQVLLSQPIHLHVFGVYSDGSKTDVTSASVVTPDDPKVHVDGPGTLTVVQTLAEALLDPNHVVNVQYGGFTEAVHINLKLPALQTLQLGTGGVTGLQLNSQLPAVQGIFDGGATANLASDFPGLTWSLQPRGPLGTTLGLLGLNLDQILTVTNGRVTAVSNTLLNQVVGLLGSALPINARATYSGVTSNVMQATVSQ